eukprot:CAMPEP_0184504570 /NCGR_PEP_ID=MMETSP0113_2-20130426/52536_1 /TAXON_ID=91329 /ORGANISM="Norrisiella sphaerica, Strain BC52" /LENGTH=518 /DNA_ID=CAMNT_0026894223 /DNA_START=208 /DNA_END=1764 /DNA_ORIENTATION=+
MTSETVAGPAPKSDPKIEGSEESGDSKIETITAGQKREREDGVENANEANGETKKVGGEDSSAQPRRRRRKKRGWDVGPGAAGNPSASGTISTAGANFKADPGSVNAAARAAELLKESIAAAQKRALEPAAIADNPKQRELYVGNLQRGISGELVQGFFNNHQLLREYHHQGLPCVRVQLDGGGTFAFCEFRSPEIATKALGVAGEILLGRPIKTGRPRGYVDPMSGNVNEVKSVAQPNDPNKKAREIYVGNIMVGVTSEQLVQLFDQALGPNVVVGCSMNESGKFCFIEFKTAETATKALSLNGMDLVGRPLRVGRPAGYTPGLTNHMQGGLGLGGMGLGGLGMGAGILGMAGGLGVNPMLAGLGIPNNQALLALSGLGGQNLNLSMLQGLLGSNPGALSGIPGLAGLPNTGAASMSGVGAPKATTNTGPSQTVVLENMITERMLTDEREYKECREDIRIECEGFGEVIDVVMPKAGAERGKVFVSFKTIEAAVKAVKVQLLPQAILTLKCIPSFLT